MSRNQKPGKFKLVAGTPQHDRRASDRAQAEAAGGADDKGAGPETTAASPAAINWLVVLLFLVASAAGGAGMTYLAFIGKIPA